jgi:hypothetical protein
MGMSWTPAASAAGRGKMLMLTEFVMILTTVLAFMIIAVSVMTLALFLSMVATPSHWSSAQMNGHLCKQFQARLDGDLL